MANHMIKDPPEFSDVLRRLETTDPAHADVFNTLFSVLINNDIYLRQKAESTAQDRHAVRVRVREPTLPDYGLAETQFVAIYTADYSGTSPITAQVEGTEYDVTNMKTKAKMEDAPDGTIMIRKLEG